MVSGGGGHTTEKSDWLRSNEFQIRCVQRALTLAGAVTFTFAPNTHPKTSSGRATAEHSY